eukprot:Tbor_TRINITY_DN3868_c0_g1::TRINITY_DN3868_c0_g1_i1::g.5552::m.5552/K12178/COPS4, CSN4; COP9 signalosome complex subunit 4
MEEAYRANNLQASEKEIGNAIARGDESILAFITKECAACSSEYQILLLKLLVDKLDNTTKEIFFNVALAARIALGTHYSVENGNIEKAVQIIKPASCNTDEQAVLKATSIAELYVNFDEPTSAEHLIKRVSEAATSIKHNNKELWIRYNRCAVMIMDGRKKYLEAGFKYKDFLSLIDDEEEINLILCAAITCALLSEPGSRRSRLISMLHQDKRAEKCISHRHILKKMYNNRVLRHGDIDIISESLKRHHKQDMPTALIKHNVKVVSEVYYNITMRELASLLGVAPGKAEEAVSNMISENAISGSIDQVNNLITFQSQKDASILEWDKDISAVCDLVSTIADKIMKEHQ